MTPNQDVIASPQSGRGNPGQTQNAPNQLTTLH